MRRENNGGLYTLGGMLRRKQYQPSPASGRPDAHKVQRPVGKRGCVERNEQVAEGTPRGLPGLHQQLQGLLPGGGQRQSEPAGAMASAFAKLQGLKR